MRCAALWVRPSRKRDAKAVADLLRAAIPADERTEGVFNGRHRTDAPESLARRAAGQADIPLAATKLETCRIAGPGR